MIPDSGSGMASPRLSISERDCEESRYYQDVIITKANNGFIVRVGCRTLVAYSWEEVVTGLSEYWQDPKRAEAKYRQNDK